MGEEKSAPGQEAEAPPPTGTSSAPPEGAHKVAEYRVTALAPSFEKTNGKPVPYNIWAKADDDLLFSPDVMYRGTPAMKMSSRISCNYGDEPADPFGGVVSQGKQGLQAPITSSSRIRINGSWAIRDGDRFEMDKATVDGPGNTIGEGRLVRDRAPKEAPEDKRSLWQKTKDGARKAAKAAGEWMEEHPRTMGAVQVVGGVAEGVGSVMLAAGGTAADATGVGAVVGVPAQALGAAGALNAADNVWTGLKQLWTGQNQKTLTQQGAGALATAAGASPETVQNVETAAGLGQAALGLGVGSLGGVNAARRAATAAGEATELAKDAKVAKSATQAAEETSQIASKTEKAAEAGETGVRVTRSAYEYNIDSLGRTTRAKGKLKLNKAARDPEVQRAAGGADRLKTDQGGHLIGSRFDGPSDAINTVAQNQNLNQGAWKSMENSWARALEAGQDVVVDIRPNYVGDSLRPTSFDVNYTIDGVGKSVTFSNMPGQVFPR